MSPWEKQHKHALDSVSAMIAYADSVNSDHESKEFADALIYWVENMADDFNRQWQIDNMDI